MIAIALPITLCRRIELVAESKNIDFSQAVSFLLEKVEAPFILSRKGGSTFPPFSSDTDNAALQGLPDDSTGAASVVGAGSICAGESAGEQDEEAR